MKKNSFLLNLLVFSLFTATLYVNFMSELNIPLINFGFFSPIITIILYAFPIIFLINNFSKKLSFLFPSLLLILFIDITFGLNNIGLSLSHWTSSRVLIKLVTLASILFVFFIFIKMSFILKEKMIIAVLLFFSFNTLSTLIISYSFFEKNTPSLEQLEQKKTVSKKPIIIHFILDGMMSPGAIPVDLAETDSALFRKEVSTLMNKHNFLVYQNVYSRFSRTIHSIPALLNFSSGKKHTNGGFSSQSKHFKVYSSMGYDLSIFQSQNTNYCQSKEEQSAASCYTLNPYNHYSKYIPAEYSLKLQKSLRFSPKYFIELLLSSQTNSYLINYTNQLLNKIGDYFNIKIKVHSHRYNPHMFSKWFGEIGKKIMSMEKGSLAFSHIISPHKPYVLNDNCELKIIKINSETDKENIRLQHFKEYFSQATCVLRSVNIFLETIERNSKFDDAIILIHGDHGSRIGGGKEDQDILAKYPTFFAIKSKNISSGYDNTFVSLQSLFAAYAKTPPIDIIDKRTIDFSSWVYTDNTDNTDNTDFKEMLKF